MLTIHLFGSPTVTIDNQPLTKLTQAHTLIRLLVYLVMHRDVPQARVKLATLFYPDQDESTARRNLNTVLSRLRTTLGDCSCILADNQTVQFDAAQPFWLDVAEFERNATHQQIDALEIAIALYRAEFMEGFYDDWCLAIRERLHELYILALQTSSTLHQGSNQLDLALARTRQWIAADGLNEEAHRQGIELCLRADMRFEARQQFEHYKTLWRDELKLEPSPHMLMLAQRSGLWVEADATSDQTKHDIALLSETQRGLNSIKTDPESAMAQTLRQQLNTEIVGYTEKLGDLYKSQYAVDEALVYYKLSLDAIAQLSTSQNIQRELSIRRKCDEIYDLSSRRMQQAQNLQAIYDLAIGLAEPSACLDALLRSIWFECAGENYAAAIAFAERATNIAPQCTVMEQATTYRLTGLAYFSDCRFKHAYQHFAEALRLGQSMNASTALQVDLINLASVDIACARYEEALQTLNRANELTSHESLPIVLARLEGTQGQVYIKLDKLKQADLHLNHAMKLAKAIGDRGVELWLAGRMANLYLQRGDIDRAITFGQHYYRIAKSAEDAFGLVDLGDWLAKLYIRMGNGQQALMWADQSLKTAKSHNIWRYQLRGNMRHAQASLLLHQFDQAQQYADQAIYLLKQRDAPIAEANEVMDTHQKCLNLANSGAKLISSRLERLDSNKAI